MSGRENEEDTADATSVAYRLVVGEGADSPGNRELKRLLTQGESDPEPTEVPAVALNEPETGEHQEGGE